MPFIDSTSRLSRGQRMRVGTLSRLACSRSLWNRSLWNRSLWNRSLGRSCQGGLRTGVAALLAGLLAVGPVLPAAAQQQGGAPTYTLKVGTDLVLTNVIVRDKKTGAVVRGLKASDFTIVEDKKQQQIRSFDFQSVDEAVQLNEARTRSGTAPAEPNVAKVLNGDTAPDPQSLRDHRLIVLFFDLSSMQPEDIDRAVESATDYINKKMEPADMVSVASLDTTLKLDQDFTNDKTALLHAVGSYNGTNGAGFGAGNEGGTTDGTADDSSSFTADDSEYNALNTDRELYAIRSIAKSLEKLEQKKSMLYFSGGLTRQGIENQASLRAATNEAVKANMAIYAVDSRGLETVSVVGSASTGSLRGTSAFSGASMQSNLNANFSSQETLGTLSTDTGGKAFFDSNDFAPAFQQVQHDTEAYYILGFRSSNTKKDGTFRHLTITVNRPDTRIEYRKGYYAPADFQHSKNEDREQQLADQMRSDLPASDVALYLEALYFRLKANSFYVPVSLIVPGSQIPFIKNGAADKANLDILGQVKNAQGIIVGNIRDTVQLSLNPSQQASKRNIQYTTGFTLASGTYHLKFVVRENQTGNMGSFETDIQVPNMTKDPMKLSSVVLASQRTPVNTKKVSNPLVRDGVEWVPNIPHIFRQDQHLYFLYEVYDPAKEGAVAAAQANATAQASRLGRRGGIDPVKVLTSIEFLSNGVKVYETPLVESTSINVPERDAVAFQFDVPLARLKPGQYVVQVNAIDDAGGSFSFPRTAIRIAPAAAPAPAAATPSAAPTR